MDDFHSGNPAEPKELPTDFLERLDRDIGEAGGELEPDELRQGSIGTTMFDLPNSEDGTLVVLLPREHLLKTPSQALLRIKSTDGRTYLGVVAAGPFAEPDSLRGDAPMLVNVQARGGIFLPPYHGRIQVNLLGEERADGKLVPPRFRPLPNSPVFVLDEVESAAVLKAGGDIGLGLAFGYDAIEVGIPSDQKAVLPRHTAILGTTGGGKSTTVSRLIKEAQKADMAVIVLDVEGEYTHLHEPTEDPNMLLALSERGQQPAGVPVGQMTVYHLVGREPANPKHPNLRPFSLQFARLSPHTIIEILDLSDAQQERFLKAYDIAKAVMRDLDIFPQRADAKQEQLALEIDEFERGWPRLTLQMMLDLVGACLAKTDKREIELRSPPFTMAEANDKITKRIAEAHIPGNVSSWAALFGRLARLSRLKVFDSPEPTAKPLIYSKLLQPGQVSLVDLSAFGASELSNIVIADLLRGLLEAQDDAYQAWEQGKAGPPARVLVIIEEAHEFLSAERIDKMPILFEQVARIAKRGRKRWLGLVFVTQLPQHLPRQIFGLVNSYILHKITDPQVVSTLERIVPGIEKSLWQRLPGLAPGQAIVSFPHMSRPLLIAVDPTPCKLRMVE
jgi:DNA helicase HerA-like ATPase